MHTKETTANSTDETIELYLEVGRKLGRIRRAAGLSHEALADKLGVPVGVTEILENGILIPAEDGRFRQWSGCPFSHEELVSISGKLNRVIVSGVQAQDAEKVFFCPVTINCAGILDEARILLKNRDLSAGMMDRIVAGIGMKCRLLSVESGREAVALLKKQLSCMLAAYETRTRFHK